MTLSFQYIRGVVCVVWSFSPISSQEAQAGGTDFVIEYDHGQNLAGGGVTACDGNVPPLLVPAVLRRLVTHQGQGYVQVSFFMIYKTSNELW